MGRFFLPFFDDEPTELIERFEGYREGVSPGYFDAHDIGLLIEYYLSYGMSDEAEDVIELGNKLHPNNSLIQIKRAKLATLDYKHQEVLDIISGLSELATDLDVKFMLVEALVGLEKIKEAEQEAEQILKVKDSDYDWICFDLGLVFAEAFENDIAIKILERGLAFNPNNIEILKIVADAYFYTLDFPQAIESLERVVKIDPFQFHSWLGLADLYSEEMMYDKALEAMEYAIAIRGNEKEQLLQYGHALFNVENYSEALEKFQKYLEFYPTILNTHEYIADCFAELEDPTRAFEHYEIAYINDTDNIKALNGMALMKINLMEFEHALAYTNAAIEKDPKSPEAWENLGDIYLFQKHFELSFQAYENSLEYYIVEPDLSLKLAHIYMEFGKYNEAIDHYESAMTFSDDHIEFIEVFLAVAHYKVGNIVEMFSYLNEAMKKNNDSSSLFLELCPEAKDIVDVIDL